MEPEHQQRVEELGLPRDAPFGVYNTPLSEKLPDCVPTLYHVVFPPTSSSPCPLKKKCQVGLRFRPCVGAVCLVFCILRDAREEGAFPVCPCWRASLVKVPGLSNWQPVGVHSKDFSPLPPFFHLMAALQSLPGPSFLLIVFFSTSRSHVALMILHLLQWGHCPLLRWLNVCLALKSACCSAAPQGQSLADPKLLPLHMLP